jgi:hypothetical protein
LRPKTPVAAGTRIKCPKCATVFAVPADEPAPRPKPAAIREEPEDLDEMTETLDDEPEVDEPEDDRPAKRKKKKSVKKGVPLWVWLTAGGLGFLFLMCLGCGGFFYYIGSSVVNAGSGSVTFLNYAQIQKGAAEAQVKTILGEPSQRIDLGNIKTVSWQNGNNIITVVFMADKATDRYCHLTNASGLKIDQSGFASQ